MNAHYKSSYSVNKHYQFHMIFFASMSFLFFLFTPAVFISRILGVLISVGVLIHMRKIRFAHNSWLELVVFFALNIYLAFAIFGFDLFFASRMIEFGRLVRFSYFILGILWTSYVLQSVFDALKFFVSLKKVSDFKKKDSYWKKWLILFAILFSVFMVWQRAFIIIISADSYGYMGTYLGARYELGRSPVFSFINGLILRFAPTSPSVAWIAIAQITAFSSLLSTILMYFHKNFVRFKYVIIAAIFLPLIPSFALHTIVVWVDLANGLLVLWFTYILFRLISEVVVNATASKNQRISLYIQLCFALVLIFFVRTNTMMVYVIMVPILIVFFILKKKWEVLIPIFISIVFVLLIRFPGHNALEVRYTGQSSSVRFFAGLHDLQATYYRGGDFSERSLDLLKQAIPNIDDLRERFIPDFVDFYHWGDGTFQARPYGHPYRLVEFMSNREFIMMYADTFVRNPWTMLRSMLHRTRAYWAIDSNTAIRLVNWTGILNLETRTVTTYAPQLDVYRGPSLVRESLQIYMREMASRAPATFIWNFGFWTALLLITGGWVILIKRQYIWLLAYLPVLLYLVTIFLTMGWTDFRYGLPVMFCGMFLPVAVVLLDPGSKQLHKGVKK